jgi:predicted KAP-like P-loop ATPase
VKNRLVCKRHAPFPLSPVDWISPDGSWGSRRRYGYINAWSPPIMQAVRCNQDIKLISNGSETKDMTWYFSGYVAKNQRDITNSCALLANRLAFHEKQEHYTSETTAQNKRLIQRCANTLSREQVFSAPEVISYLMGKGNHKISHHFATLYTADLSNALQKAYPKLRYKR